MREINLNSKINYIHLLSGGLDSGYSILRTAKKIKKEERPVIIHPIFFDYGQKASEIEWKKANEVVEYVRDFLNDKSIIDDPIKISLKSDLFQWCKNDAFVGRENGKEGELNPEIENRNMVLFSVLASYLISCADHQKIITSRNSITYFNIGSGFKERELPDCNANFFIRTSALIGVYRPNLKFLFEILKSASRQKIINNTKELLRGDESALENFLRRTISCYYPTIDGKPCGVCSKCISLKKEKMETSHFK